MIAERNSTTRRAQDGSARCTVCVCRKPLRALWFREVPSHNGRISKNAYGDLNPDRRSNVFVSFALHRPFISLNYCWKSCFVSRCVSPTPIGHQPPTLWWDSQLWRQQNWTWTRRPSSCESTAASWFGAWWALRHARSRRGTWTSASRKPPRFWSRVHRGRLGSRLRRAHRGATPSFRQRPLPLESSRPQTHPLGRGSRMPRPRASSPPPRHRRPTHG